MGSSASKTRSKKVKEKQEDVDSLGFPTRGSLKSLEMFGSFEELNHSQPNIRYLESLVKDQETKIRTLTEENNRLLNKVKDLETSLNQFSLQLAATSKPQLVTQEDEPFEESTDIGGRNLPRIGDHVVAMWGESKWQYFTATIKQFNKNTLKYTIEWDDGDPTGTGIAYYNLALDKIPDEDQIGVGSKVLFHQARYTSCEVHGVTRSAGLRWHQGEIDRIYKGTDGKKRYNGRHTKGRDDGKWVTYKGYSEAFTDYTIEDFRMPPNVFDILSSVNSEVPAEVEEADVGDPSVFVSYVKVNCPSAVRAKEIESSDLPPSYDEALLQNMCDPRDIVTQLQRMGVRVFAKEDQDDDSLFTVVNAMKKAKVFVACLSDEYASNDRCRMEFQYAKKTLKLPVIPVVVGAGSFQWQLTVVGLLIAGELYIHFKNKEVEGSKMTELTKAIKNIVPSLDISGVQYPATGNASLTLHANPEVSVTGDQIKLKVADYFFSYCWMNSKEAFDQKQIAKFVGHQWTDPRLILRKLSSSYTNLKPWIDIERLQSASENLGMFGQIASAMNSCKFVISCISTEYAESDNSRMEFQFAMRSLKKPVILLIVGEGNEWKRTAVGKLIEEEGLPSVDFRNIASSVEMEQKIIQLIEVMKKLTADLEETTPSSSQEKAKFQAPVTGDHVVCLHQRWAYFMATVESFDPERLEYTVNWDDGDPTGRVQSYKDLALDVVPTDQLGIGSIVMFEQGGYGSTEGNNTGGKRYHQGRITRVYQDDSGITRYNGEHTKGEKEGKMINYRSYSFTFTGNTKEELRVSPNAMDALMACKRMIDTSMD